MSGWFKNITLSPDQKNKILKKWRDGLVKARVKASQWHRNEKEKRLAKAQVDAEKFLNSIDFKDKNISEIALAMLYMGEGIKSNPETGMGNSDPLILKTFLYILEKNHNLDIRKIRCELYLRADQNSNKMKRFWAHELNIPI
ncbi:MAG: hypothetical protein Q8L24_02660, partial [bacterium]|nr:hypothetical protein [bacterium]